MNRKGRRFQFFRYFLPLFETIQNKEGVVLSVGLMLLAVLLLLGATGTMITTTDLKISGKYRSSGQANYAAEAGIEEARGRLKGEASDANYAGDPSVTTDPDWSAYISTSGSWTTSKDSNYNASYKNYFPTTNSKTSQTVTANSLQANLSYWVKITHKREYDAEQAGHSPTSTHYIDDDGSTAAHSLGSPGNIIYYGYPNPNSLTPVAFTSASATEYPPIQIITSYGAKGDSSSMIRVEAGWHPGPPVTASIYSKGDISIQGGSGLISGADDCGKTGAKPPTYTKEPALTSTSGGSSPTFEGNPSTPVNGTNDIDIVSLVATLKQGATVITSDQSGTNFGSSSNYVTLYSNTSNPYNNQGLKISNGTGYGTLLVEGDLSLGGGFQWNGIILVTGTLEFRGGGGGINITGATLSNDTVDINGGLDIRYDSCQIENSIKNRAPMALSWKNSY